MARAVKKVREYVFSFLSFDFSLSGKYLSSLKWPGGRQKKTGEAKSLHNPLAQQPIHRLGLIILSQPPGFYKNKQTKNTRTLGKVNKIAVPVERKCNSIFLKFLSLKENI